MSTENQNDDSQQKNSGEDDIVAVKTQEDASSQQQQQQQQKQIVGDLLSEIEDFVQTTVVLRKDKKNELGISIVGGTDTYLESVCVSSVDPEGVAGKDRRLKRGDIMLAVNDVSLRDVSQSEALRLIRVASSPVRLLILRENPQVMFTTTEAPRKYVTVELRRTNITDRLGLSLMERNCEGGVFVTWVEPGSIASKHGRIMQGDRLLEINGISINDKSIEEVTTTLQQLEGAVVLLLGRVPELAAAIQEWARNKGNMSPGRLRTSTWSYTTRDKAPTARPGRDISSVSECNERLSKRKDGEQQLDDNSATHQPNREFRVRASTLTWNAPARNLFRNLRLSLKRERNNGPVTRIAEEAINVKGTSEDDKQQQAASSTDTHTAVQS